MRQAGFVAALLDPAQPVPQGLVNPDGTAAQKRFDVYRNNVAAGLSDALEVAFPVLRRLLGDDFFRSMAGVYLRRIPPTSPLMMHFGAQMPVFLQLFAPVAHLPYLPDIARVEIALRAAYHAADAAPVDAAALATVAPEVLMATRMRLAPSVQIIASLHPLYAIWQRASDPGAPPPGSDPETILITRPVYDPVLHPLDPAATRAVQALANGRMLGEALVDGGEALDLGALLSLLLAQRAIVALT